MEYYSYGYRRNQAAEYDSKKKRPVPVYSSSTLWDAKPAKPVKMAEVFPENGTAASEQFDAIFPPEAYPDNPWVHTTRDYIVRTAMVTPGQVTAMGILGITDYDMPVLQMKIGRLPHVFIPTRKDKTDNSILKDDWKNIRRRLNIVSGNSTDPTHVVCHPIIHD